MLKEKITLYIKVKIFCLTWKETIVETGAWNQQYSCHKPVQNKTKEEKVHKSWNPKRFIEHKNEMKLNTINTKYGEIV